MIELRGPRLTLRPMTRVEYHQFQQNYVPDPVMDPDPYQYDAASTDEAYDRRNAEASMLSLGIYLSGAIIGSLRFKRIDRAGGRCEIGVVLDTDAHKERGYGGEAFALAVDYAFGNMSLTRVFADTMGGNIRMQRILDRLGFRCYSRMRDAYDMRGRWEDRLDYILERQAWATAKEQAACMRSEQKRRS